MIWKFASKHRIKNQAPTGNMKIAFDTTRSRCQRDNMLFKMCHMQLIPRSRLIGITNLNRNTWFVIYQPQISIEMVTFSDDARWIIIAINGIPMSDDYFEILTNGLRFFALKLYLVSNRNASGFDQYTWMQECKQISKKRPFQRNSNRFNGKRARCDGRTKREIMSNHNFVGLIKMPCKVDILSFSCIWFKFRAYTI